MSTCSNTWRTASWTRPSRGDRMVLIVDQFDELFTACQDPDKQALFIRLLATGADDGGAVSS